MSQIVCKLSLELKARVTNMRFEAFFICSHGTYTIFLPSEAKNTTFESGTFGSLGKNSILRIYREEKT